MTTGPSETDTGAMVQAAFKHITAKEFDAARALVERALALAPSSGAVAHAKAHLDGDSGAYEAGAAFLRDFLTREDPFKGINAHTSWHLAAMEMALGNLAEAVAWHQRVVGPSAAHFPMTFYSAASLLWQIHARGWDAPLPWEPLRTAAQARQTSAGGDRVDAVDRVAQAMVYIATGDNAALAGLVDRLREEAGEQPTAGEVTLPVILGLRAFWQQDYAAARDHLSPLMDSLVRLSTFQDHRTPIEETYREAVRRAG